MEEQDIIEYKDYFYNPKYDNHHLSSRYKLDGEQTHLKVRISEHGRSKMYFKINFVEGFTEIWEGKNALFRIEQVISYDLTDMAALRNKLRTYLVFS